MFINGVMHRYCGKLFVVYQSVTLVIHNYIAIVDKLISPTSQLERSSNTIFAFLVAEYCQLNAPGKSQCKILEF